MTNTHSTTSQGRPTPRGRRGGRNTVPHFPFPLIFFKHTNSTRTQVTVIYGGRHFLVLRIQDIDPDTALLDSVVGTGRVCVREIFIEDKHLKNSVNSLWDSRDIVSMDVLLQGWV